MERKFQYVVCVRCFTYNHRSYIIDALNGFCIQRTNAPFVCTIVDDASTDGAQEVVQRYLSEHFDLSDPEVARIEDTDNYVLIFARHKINIHCFFAVLFLKYNHYRIKKSKYLYISQWLDNSKYTAICEGDDYWVFPNKLQVQVDFLDTNPNISYLCSRYNILNVNSGTITLAPNFYFDKIENNEKKYFIFQRDTPFLYGWITKTLTCMYRSVDFDRDYLVRYKYYRDVHLVYSLLSKGDGACFSYIGGVYRVNPLSTFGGKTKLEQATQNYYVYEELYQKTNDKVMREVAMTFYLILFKNRVPGFCFPSNRLQFRTILIKWPKSRLQAIRKALLHYFKR